MSYEANRPGYRRWSDYHLDDEFDGDKPKYVRVPLLMKDGARKPVATPIFERDEIGRLVEIEDEDKAREAEERLARDAADAYDEMCEYLQNAHKTQARAPTPSRVREEYAGENEGSDDPHQPAGQHADNNQTTDDEALRKAAEDEYDHMLDDLEQAWREPPRNDPVTAARQTRR